MLTPHEVMIFSVEEVLMDIYDGDPSKVDTDVATKAFFEWIVKHDAHYYSAKVINATVVLRAVLDAIQKNKEIVVVATLPTLPDND